MLRGPHSDVGFFVVCCVGRQVLWCRRRDAAVPPRALAGRPARAVAEGPEAREGRRACASRGCRASAPGARAGCTGRARAEPPPGGGGAAPTLGQGAVPHVCSVVVGGWTVHDRPVVWSFAVPRSGPAHAAEGEVVIAGPGSTGPGVLLVLGPAYRRKPGWSWPLLAEHLGWGQVRSRRPERSEGSESAGLITVPSPSAGWVGEPEAVP